MYKYDQYLYTTYVSTSILLIPYYSYFIYKTFVSQNFCLRYKFAFRLLMTVQVFHDFFKSMAPNDSRGRWLRQRVPSVLNDSVNLLEPWLRGAWLPISPKYVPLDSPSLQSSRHILKYCLGLNPSRRTVKEIYRIGLRLTGLLAISEPASANHCRVHLAGLDIGIIAF